MVNFQSFNLKYISILVSFKPYSAVTNGVQGCYKNVTEVALKCTNELGLGNLYDDSINSFNQKIPISSEVIGSSSYTSKGGFLIY